MDITIKIDDDSRFKEILDKELEALSHDELKQVILGCIREALIANNYELAKTIFVDYARSTYSVYYDTNNNKLTEFTKMLISTLDYSKLQDILDAMLDNLKDNHEHLLKSVMLDNMIAGIMNDYHFREGLKEAIFEIDRQKMYNQ